MIESILAGLNEGLYASAVLLGFLAIIIVPGVVLVATAQFIEKGFYGTLKLHNRVSDLEVRIGALEE